MYCATLRHQSVLTKTRSKKETTKSERRGNNNKTDVRGDLSLTNVQKGQQVKIHTGEVKQVRPPCSHPLLLTRTLGVYKHQHTTTTQNHSSQEFTNGHQMWWLTRQLYRMSSNNNALSAECRLTTMHCPRLFCHVAIPKVESAELELELELVPGLGTWNFHETKKMNKKWCFSIV